MRGLTACSNGDAVADCDCIQFLRASLWSSAKDPQDLVALTYRKLINVAEEAGAEVDAELCLA